MGFSLKHLFHTAAQLNPVTLGTTLTHGAAGLFGGGGNDQAAKVDALSAQARAAAGEQYAAGQVEQRRSIGETRGSFAGARNALGAGRTQAIQAVGDAGAQSGANAAQSLSARGLYNTTLLDNAQQGISANTSRAVAGIDAHYAQILGQLGIQEQNSVNAIRQNIASGAFQHGALQSGLYQNQAGLVNGQQQQDPNAWLDSLFQIGGTALGYAIGGPAGGAIGGQAAGAFTGAPSGGIY